eukprot:11611042-Karenia_brevis.AAC.1
MAPWSDEAARSHGRHNRILGVHGQASLSVDQTGARELTGSTKCASGVMDLLALQKSMLTSPTASI